MKRVKAMLAALMMLGAVTTVYPTAQVSAEETQTLEGTYLIRNVNSQIVMDVAGGGTANGTNVQQWGGSSCESYNTWRLEYAGDCYYRIYSMLEGGDKLLLTAGTGSDATDSNICIHESTGGDDQLFTIFANPDGTFKFLNKTTMQAVEVVNAETSSGANVQQWAMNGHACQNWELISVDYLTEELTETPCTSTADNSFIPGDVNDDGVVNAFDTALSKKLLLAESATERQKHAGNVSGDEQFSMVDVIQIQKFLLTGKGDFIKAIVPGTNVYAGIDAESYSNGWIEDSNTGFVTEGGYLNLNNAAGETAEWNVAASGEGVHAITVRYANGGTGDRTISVTVNGQPYAWTLQGAPTGAWTTWAEETIYVPLQDGVNKLTFTSQTTDGASNIDTITVAAAFDQEQSASVYKDPEDFDIFDNTYGVGRQMEALDRGVSATLSGSGVLVSWRKLATDNENTFFKLYQNGNYIATINAGEATNYFIDGAATTDVFTVDTFMETCMTDFASPAVVCGIKNSGQSGAYLEFGVTPPSEQTMPDGTTCTYTPNDTSCGDVDGDGQYELIVKWDPSNSKDNANEGYTGSVFIDCYKLDGTRLWRIDLGKNIRAGAHYTQFMVYDFDGDGKAEMMCKTADGTTDANGTVIGNASADYRNSAGRVLDGPEYLTLFDGLTGAALDTVDYEPARGTVTDWGDNYGNRVDRFLATVAYFDGQTPSAVFARGYYARTAVTAYDVVDKKIVKRWAYDTGTNSSDPGFGQGNHSLIPMDVDADGKDEILYGSCCFDDNGTVKWSTGLKHGDCMQAGDLIPEREGLEVFQVHEEHWCAEVHDAATGEVIWSVDGSDDVGRGIALNISADYPGMEFTSVADGLIYAYNASTGQIESTGLYWSDQVKWGMNSAIWWDGDLEREAMDRTMIEQFTQYRLFTGDGSYNNYSKSNACLTADLFGDWREEIVLQADSGTKIRIFSTTFETEYSMTTLMHDYQYRLGVATENVGYNQAPNTSFFLGTGYDLPVKPTVYTIN